MIGSALCRFLGMAVVLSRARIPTKAMRLGIHELMDPKQRKPVGACSLELPHKCELSGGQGRGSWERVEGRSRAPSR